MSFPTIPQSSPQIYVVGLTFPVMGGKNGIVLPTLPSGNFNMLLFKMAIHSSLCLSVYQRVPYNKTTIQSPRIPSGTLQKLTPGLRNGGELLGLDGDHRLAKRDGIDKWVTSQTWWFWIVILGKLPNLSKGSVANCGRNSKMMNIMVLFLYPIISCHISLSWWVQSSCLLLLSAYLEFRSSIQE